LFPIHRKASQKGEVISNQGIFEEFLLGHKVKQWIEGKADDRYIGPVLMFGENDHRSIIGEVGFPLGLDPIKNREDPSGNPSGRRIDKQIPSHHHKPMSKFKIQISNQCQRPNVRRIFNFGLLKF
jgi:hypothetical protein